VLGPESIRQGRKTWIPTVPTIDDVERVVLRWVPMKLPAEVLSTFRNDSSSSNAPERPT